MKSLNILLTISFSFLLLACSNTRHEDIIEKRLNAILKKNGHDMKHSDVEIKIANDSLLLAHYIVKENELLDTFECYIQRDTIEGDGHSHSWYLCSYMLSKKQSILSMTNNFLNSMDKNGVGRERFKYEDVVYIYGKLQRIAVGDVRVED